MATHNTLTSLFQDIADAIRKKFIGRKYIGVLSNPSSVAGVTNNGSIYVSLFALKTNQNCAAKSTDGINWTLVSLAPKANANTQWSSITYGKGKFMALSYYDVQNSYSTDGANWSNFYVSNAPWRGIYFAGDKFFISDQTGSNGLSYSADGFNWTSIGRLGVSAIYSMDYFNEKYVALGMIVYNNGAYEIGGYSTNGINWTQISIGAIDQSGHYIYGIAHNNNKIVAVSNKGYIFYSTDAINWTTIRTSVNSFDTIIWTGSYFLAVSNNGKAYRSEDGIDWAEILSANSIGKLSTMNGNILSALGETSILFTMSIKADDFPDVIRAV